MDEQDHQDQRCECSAFSVTAAGEVEKCSDKLHFYSDTPVIMLMVPLYNSHSILLPCLSIILWILGRLERIVLWWDFSDVIVADDRHFAEDVVSNFGHFAEEEEGEDSGGSTEACCYAATVEKVLAACLSLRRTTGARGCDNRHVWSKGLVVQKPTQ